MQTIAEFAPDGLDAGVGLTVRYDLQHFALVLAGKRNRCPAGELFYARAGGPRMPLGRPVARFCWTYSGAIHLTHEPSRSHQQDVADLLRQALDY